MSTTTFFIILVGGGLLTNALCGLLLPEERTGGLVTAIWSGTIITFIAGVAVTEILGASNEIGLAAVAVGPIAVGSGIGHGGSDHGGWGFGDSGGSDSGGGGGGD